jgi:hypothetical protein
MEASSDQHRRASPPGQIAEAGRQLLADRPPIGIPASNAPKTHPDSPLDTCVGARQADPDRLGEVGEPDRRGEGYKPGQREGSARFNDLERLGEPALGQARLGRPPSQPATKAVLQLVKMPGLAFVRPQGGDLSLERVCHVDVAVG